MQILLDADPTIQGHSSPGIYARAFIEGRLTTSQMDLFRQETKGGLSSYPHPWLMPDFWQFPTVSMGLGPIMAIYRPALSGICEDRGLIPSSDARSGPSGGRRDRRAGDPGRARAGLPREARQSHLWSSTATCSAWMALYAATARSSRNSKRFSAAPAGTSLR